MTCATLALCIQDHRTGRVLGYRSVFRQAKPQRSRASSTDQGHALRVGSSSLNLWEAVHHHPRQDTRLGKSAALPNQALSQATLTPDPSPRGRGEVIYHVLSLRWSAGLDYY